jgi:t-SNARE complex subunit (syntaxin)
MSVGTVIAFDVRKSRKQPVARLRLFIIIIIIIIIIIYLVVPCGA